MSMVKARNEVKVKEVLPLYSQFLLNPFLTFSYKAVCETTQMGVSISVRIPL